MRKAQTGARSAANKAPGQTREVKPRGVQPVQRPGMPKTVKPRKK